MFRNFVRENRSFHEPWVQPPDTPQAFRTFMINRNRSDRYERFLVLRVEDDRLIGVINLNEIVRGVTQTAYLAYYGSQHACGTGAMAEGLQLIMRHAFDRMKLHRLEAGIQPGNERSIRFVKRAGFRCEGLARKLIQINGVWCDHERWAILDEEWRQTQRKPRPTDG